MLAFSEALLKFHSASIGGVATLGSLSFVTNVESDHEHAALAVIPDGFGDGEFTLEMWLKPTVATFSAAADGSPAQLTDWMTHNPAPYSASDWWFRGNFLIDGHQNGSSNYHLGTFSVQLANGRVRWTFGDGAAAQARTGALHGVVGTTNIVDGNWHKVSLVRRWDGGTGAILELWVDGAMEDSETSTSRTNMATTYWDGGFPGFPVNQRNWMIGVEKQSATTVGIRTQYEDYKGLFTEMAFFGRAKSSNELTNDWSQQTLDGANGLAGIYRFPEQSGSLANDAVAGLDMTLVNQQAGGMWSSAGPFG